jgi:hypothetical protein
LLNQISVAGIECTLWSKQLLVFSRQKIDCELRFRPLRYYWRFLPFSNIDADVLGKIKGLQVKPTSCLIDCCVELFCVIRKQVFGGK